LKGQNLSGCLALFLRNHSDKTLQSLAKALNLSPWELIYTPDPKKPKPPPKDRQNRKQVAALVTRQKDHLTATVAASMETLILDLVQKADKKQKILFFFL
jgi:hypothetical protein